jgi:hypothetical protein
MVNGICDLRIIDDPTEIAQAKSPAQKPFLRLSFPNSPTIQNGQIVVDVSLTIGEMIGGAAHGAQLRFGFVKEE